MSDRYSQRQTTRRTNNNLVRGTIDDTNDTGAMMTATVKLDDGRIVSDVELPQLVGYAYRPNDGAEVFVGFVGGSPSHPVITSVTDRRVRPTGTLAKGEAVHFDDAGQTIHMTADGIQIKTDLPITYETSQNMTIKAQNLMVEGDIQSTGDVSASGNVNTDGSVNAVGNVNGANI